MRAKKIAGYLLGFFLVLVFSFSPGGQQAAPPDIVITDIEFEIIPQPTEGERPQLKEKQAILGDIIRIRAVIANKGGPVGKFRVEFFFLEDITKETDQIDTVVVYGLKEGEELKPTATWNTSWLIPGEYVIIARAIPEGEDPNTLCDNEIPRGECDGEPAKPPTDYTLVILTEGLAISQPRVGSPIPKCPMGEDTIEQTDLFQITNLGTIDIKQNDLGLKSFYKPSLTAEPESANYARIDFLFPSPVPRGERGTLRINLDFQEFNEIFYPYPKEPKLGDVNQVQLVLQLDPGGRRIFIPGKRELLKFYTSVDRWRFPLPKGCAGAGDREHQEGESVKIPPAVAPDERMIYHILVAKDGTNILFALSPETGGKDWELPLPEGVEAQGIAIGKGKDGAGNIIDVVYVSASNGHVYAIGKPREKPPEIFWEGPKKEGALENIGSSLTKPLIVTDEQGMTKSIYAGSEKGLYAINPDGNLQWFQEGNVTRSPIYTKIGGTDVIWYASNDEIRKVNGENGDILERSEFAPITTSLKKSSLDEKIIIYFGTNAGTIYALDENLKSVGEQLKTIEPNDVTGIAIAKQSRNPEKDIIFATIVDGEIHAREFDGREFFEIQEEDWEERIEKELDVFTDEENKALGVLITSSTKTTPIEGRLRAISPEDLAKQLEVEIWGERVEFEFTTPGKRMTSPIVLPKNKMVLVGSEDGFLYAFDLSQFK